MCWPPAEASVGGYWASLCTLHSLLPFGWALVFICLQAFFSAPRLVACLLAKQACVLCERHITLANRCKRAWQGHVVGFVLGLAAARSESILHCYMKGCTHSLTWSFVEIAPWCMGLQDCEQGSFYYACWQT